MVGWTGIRAEMLNMVHNLNVVHLHVVPDDRRERSREKKRQRFLDGAQRVIDRDGLGGVTMQALADEMDCAVGTIYTYFPSKASLVSSLQSRAVDTLRGSYLTAQPRWQEALATADLPGDLAALVEVAAFGAFWAAASVVFADEFQLQRQLLSSKVTVLTTDDVRSVMPVALRLLEQPEGLLDAAITVGALQPGDQRHRVVRWVAAMNGVLLLDEIAPVDRHLFRGGHHARALTADLLVGWGAERSMVEVAQTHVDRLAALGPMAPPPEGPGWT